MTEYLKNLYPLIFSGAEIFAVAFISAWHMKKRAKFAARFACAALAFVAFSAVAALFYLIKAEWTVAGLPVIHYVFVSAIILASVYVCFHASVKEVLFLGSTSLAARFASVKLSGILQMILVSNSLAEEGGVTAYLIRLALITACAALIYFTFTRFYKESIEREVSKDTVFLCPVIICVTAVLEFMETVLRDFSLTYRIVFALCALLYGVISLFMDYALLKQGQSEVEIAVVKQLWNEDKKHYEVLKENMDIINIKCHDLRHQVQSMRKGDINDKALEEIEKSINIYDSIIKTGNEVLDVIISDFSLRCQKSKVLLTCMADGEKINIMDEMDVYSLFGNMLENALEYEQTVLPEENRFISLTVKETNGFLVIHCENYFEGTVEIKDGIASTSKPDKSYHGFGMKSMKKISEKYHGSFEAQIADDMFQLHVLLPLGAGGHGAK
ncbi:MAG: sensor histidine kinase [Clostridiales bacterium]|nr:sensor histidine kinase [Clostridiales bacterium]